MTTKLAHRNDPDTSFTAAETLSNTAQVKAIILAELAKKPQATFELVNRYVKFRAPMGWPMCKPDSVAKRLSELHNDKLVQDSGRRVMGEYGKPVAVWEVVAK